MDTESAKYKKNIDFLEFNGVLTQNNKTIDCELVNNILIDCSEQIFTNRTLVIKNKKFTNKDIRLFYQLTEIDYRTNDIWLKKCVFPILSELTFLTTVRLYNYMGAVHMKEFIEYIYENYNYEYEPRYHQFICRKELNNSNLRKIYNLKREDYIALVSMGYNSKEILSCVSTDELLPLDITNINENFYGKFSKHKDIIDLVNETDGCFIAGGFLVHCIQEMIKHDPTPECPSEHVIYTDEITECPSENVIYVDKIVKCETGVCLPLDDCLHKEVISIEKNMCIEYEHNIGIGDKIIPETKKFRPNNTFSTSGSFDNVCNLPIYPDDFYTGVESKEENGTENFNEIYDIDIFCLRTIKDETNGIANVATNIIKKFQSKFDCRCFTNSAVTTIFIRNSPIQIQIIACGEMTSEKVLSSFDMPCCRIAYINSMLCASKSFHEVMHNNWYFEANGVFKYYRVKKYENKGFTINTNNAKIIGDETCDNYENNKWYFWRDENKNRLLHMVKLLFSPGYEYTKLPLSAITIEWKSTYDEHWNYNPANMEHRDIHIVKKNHVEYIQHTPPLDTIIINNVEILLCNFDDQNKIKLFGKSTEIEEIWNSVENIYNRPMITNLLKKEGGRLGNIHNVDIKRSKHLLINKQIFKCAAGKYLLDYNIHRCNLTLLPIATINGYSDVHINMRCVKLELLD